MTVDRRIIELYNDYVHSALPRREFLSRLANMAGGAAAAMTVLAVLEPNYAQARQVEPDDKRLKTEKIEFNGPNGPVKAYVAQPSKLGRRDKLPGVLVIHENRGLNEHIEDVARRTALAGYLAIAPDGLSVAGGAPADQEAARDLFGKTDGARIAGDVLAAVPWLAAGPVNNGKIGVVGFCYGGGLALRAAVEAVGVDCAVCFYGRPVVRRRHAQAQGAGDAALRRYRRARQCRHRRLPCGARRRRRAVQPQHVSRHTTRLPQRFERGALQRGRGQTGVGAHARFFRDLSEDLTRLKA